MRDRSATIVTESLAGGGTCGPRVRRDAHSVHRPEPRVCISDAGVPPEPVDLDTTGEPQRGASGSEI